MHTRALGRVVALSACFFGAATSWAQPVPDGDFPWVTVGHPGNAAYSGPDVNGQTAGRGSVPYSFRISRLELTTAQWMEFANVMAALGEPYRIGEGPVGGYERNFSGSGPRYVLRPFEGAAMRPVTGITWHNAARYCNWLQNGKPATLDSLVTGAYDTTTFGPPVNGQRPDALTRLPGARFFIPTLDEWLKAVHYDPDRYGPDQGGYWMYPNGTDTPLTTGSVGEGGQTNTGDPYTLSSRSYELGAYSDVQTPWGLWDASGGASEWLEDASDGTRQRRLYDGTSYFSEDFQRVLDVSYQHSSDLPGAEGTAIGLRIASVVPVPATFLCLGGGVLFFRSRRRC